MESKILLPTVTGESLPVRRWLPATASKHSVIALHGQISHSGWFAKLGQSLNARGIALYSADRRGSGEARGLSKPEDLDTLIDDIKRLANLAGEGGNVTLLLWCWGALLGLPAAPSLPISQVILAAPGICLKPEIMERAKASTPSGGTFPVPYSPTTDFSDNTEVNKFISNDKLMLSRIPAYMYELGTKLRPRAVEALQQLKVPIQCILASEDRIIDNDTTKKALAAVKMSEVPGGHAFVLENPDTLAIKIAESLNG